MSGYAPPVSAPPFQYSSMCGLFVDVEGHRHPRCSSNRLYDLLTYEDPGPAYTKAGKLRVHQPPKHKDETQSFYLAQSIHYGLKACTSKPAAKKALLEAFQGSVPALRVPDSIRKIEQNLASEYELKNAAAQKEYEKTRLLREAAAEKDRKKRKQEETELMAEFLGNPRKKVKSSTPLDIKTLSGVYVIAAPSLSDGWDCDGPLTLELGPSSTSSHLWGSFDFGAFEGKLRSCSSVKPGVSTIQFLWRGRETGEGESSYGPENVAKFTFLGNGRFKGSMYWDCLGEFELAGKRDEKASKGRDYGKEVKRWKRAFWELNESTYERERVGRWGGRSNWYGSDEEEEESNSDTGNERTRGGEDDEEEGSDEEDEDEGQDEPDADNGFRFFPENGVM